MHCTETRTRDMTRHHRTAREACNLDPAFWPIKLQHSKEQGSNTRITFQTAAVIRNECRYILALLGYSLKTKLQQNVLQGLLSHNHGNACLSCTSAVFCFDAVCQHFVSYHS